ncbi:metallophosphoesterase [Thermococcus sp.]|uniref:metallophosphoesterase family protein n=1 Tax=Thermococcus sp. TaxID=35749 RepID=UPI00345882C2
MVDLKRLALFVLLLVVFSAGCVSSPAGTGTTGTSTTSTTQEKVSGINFGKYPAGAVIGNWNKLFNMTFYTSEGYEDLVRYYFPNAKVLPASEYHGTGIAVLSPAEVRRMRLLFGKRVQVRDIEPFGYVAYRNGFHFLGPWHGVIAVFNTENGSTLVVSGTSRAGVGGALNFLKGVMDGRLKVDFNAVVRSGQFEGLVVKEIGDVNLNGLPDKGEFIQLYQLSFEEPFIYGWRVIRGANVTVDGGFIRLVNDTRVYIHALGFNVTVRVRGSPEVPLTYVIENVNPNLMELPEGAKVIGDTSVELTTGGNFSLVAKPVENYTVFAFGDHRPPGGDKPPRVFLEIRDRINNESGAFIIDGGDLVYSGTVYQWAELMKVWKWNKPIFISAGNHEYQGEGINIFHYFFGPTDYAFSLGKYRYIFANDVMGSYTLSERQFKWLAGQMELARSLGQRPVIVMHAPPYDPRPGGDDHAMNEKSAEELLKLMKEYDAFGIFSHIHIYWNGTYKGVHFIITGGGGAPLYAKPDEGGFYHYVVLTMAPGEIGIRVVKLS